MGQDQSESVDVKLENYLTLFRAWLQAFGVWSSRENFQFCITHSTALLLAPLTSQGTLRGKDWKEVMELSDAFTMRKRSSLPIWFLCDWISLALQRLPSSATSEMGPPLMKVKLRKEARYLWNRKWRSLSWNQKRVYLRSLLRFHPKKIPLYYGFCICPRDQSILQGKEIGQEWGDCSGVMTYW